MPYYYTLTEGVLEYVAGDPPASARGSFSGRAGTLRRSRKGRTSRNPNGSRKYIIDYDSNVVAYKV